METNTQFWDRVKRKYRNPNKSNSDIVRLVELVRIRNKQIKTLKGARKQ